MPMIITPESPLGIELAKHEQFPGRITDTPGNPYKFRPYPRMLYRAHKKPNGKVVCLDIPPQHFEYAHLGALAQTAYERAIIETDRINAACQTVAHSEGEYVKLRDQGWSDTQDEAIERFEAIEQEIGDASAEANAKVRRMTSKAQQEHKAAESSTTEHVTDVVGTPKSRRGTDAKKRSAAVTGKTRK